MLSKYCDKRLGDRVGEGTEGAGEPRSLCDVLGDGLNSEVSGRF